MVWYGMGGDPKIWSMGMDGWAQTHTQPIYGMGVMGDPNAHLWL